MSAPNGVSSATRHRVFRSGVVSAVAAMALLIGSSASASIGASPDPQMPGVDGRVWAMVRIGDTVYVGGSFNNVLLPGGGSAVRHDLAAFGIDGTLKSWAPSVAGAPGQQGLVFALATNGTAIYVGGDYAAINGVTRADLAAVSLTGSVNAWHADASNQVRALMVSGS